MLRGRRSASARSVLARLWVLKLGQSFGVEGHVGALAVLVGGIDLVASVLDLDLADLVALRLQLRFERRLGLPLRRRGAAALARGESGAGDGDRDGSQRKPGLHEITPRIEGRWRSMSCRPYGNLTGCRA